MDFAIRKNDTVAIIGSHPKTRDAFDYARAVDVWAFNEAASLNSPWLKRVDAIFQVHPEPIWRNPANRNDPGHFTWLTTQTLIPVFMQQAYPEVPAAVQYPLDEAKALVQDEDHYLTSSVALAIAAAVLAGYKRVEVYGVAMETNTEYQFQRDGVAFWRGFCEGRGIEFYFADDTFRNPVYGYEGEAFIYESYIRARVEELTPEVQKLTDLYHLAAAELKAKMDKMKAGENDPEGIYKIVQKTTSAGEALGLIDGAKQCNEKYLEKAKIMQGAAGDHAFSRQEFESQAKHMTDKYNDQVASLNGLGGQMDLVHVTIERAAKGSPKREKAIQGFEQLLNAYITTSNMACVYKGAAQENYIYLDKLVKGIRALGGVKSEEVFLQAQQQSAEVTNG